MNTINVTTEIITPEIARVYLTRNIVNRRITESRVNSYAEEMKKGLWQVNGDAIRFSKSGNLIDGQHRLKACILADVQFQTLVIRGLNDDSFVTIDNGKPRSSCDVFYISDIENANQVSTIVKKHIILSKETHNVVASNRGHGSASSRVGNSIVLSTYNENKDFYQEANKLSRSCYESCRAFNPSDIGAYFCYLVLNKKHPKEEVKEFFLQLCDKKSEEYSMIRQCRKMFVNDRISNYHMEAGVRQRLIIKAWNYFIQKRDVQQFRYNSEKDKDIWFI